jgi:hypothetical protein
MKITWSDIQLPTLPDAVTFADDKLRSSTAYKPTGKYIENGRFVFDLDIAANDYRQEFTERTWRKPTGKNINFPYGTTHILSYDFELPIDYVPHPSKIVIAQGHTAGEGKRPVWTLDLWSDNLRVQAMDPATGNKVYGYPQIGQLVLSTFTYGHVNSSGSMITNRYPITFTPQAGKKNNVLIIRTAALRQDGGGITIFINGKEIFSLNADFVYPDEMLTDNWKAGIYYPDIKTDSVNIRHKRQIELVERGFTRFKYSIGDFNEVAIVPGQIVDHKEVLRILSEYFNEQNNNDGEIERLKEQIEQLKAEKEAIENEYMAFRNATQQKKKNIIDILNE